jgi:hypothetical protein
VPGPKSGVSLPRDDALEHKDSCMTWREADEALLAELEEERAMTSLWQKMAEASAQPLPRRSSGLARLLRVLPGGAEAVTQAALGDPARMGELVLSDRLSDLAPELVHQLAILFDRIARSYWARRDQRDAFLAAYTRSLACFLRVREERNYILAMARRTVGSSLPQHDADSAALLSLTASIEELGASAIEGARQVDARSELALMALTRVDEAARRAGLERGSATAIVRRSDAARARAIDEALSPIAARLNEIKARGDEEASGPSAFADVARIWEWSGRDEHVERFAVDEVTALAWNLYRATNWTALRALLAPCQPLFDSLSTRVLGDPRRHIAYAAKAAQIAVFRSECATEPAREFAFAEEALRLCATHRNARLVMAHLLCDRAMQRIAGPAPRRSEIDIARAEITRAEELFPQSTKLPAAKARLDHVSDLGTGARA